MARNSNLHITNINEIIENISEILIFTEERFYLIFFIIYSTIIKETATCNQANRIVYS